jgi:transcriptional regulator of met regulon
VTITVQLKGKLNRKVSKSTIERVFNSLDITYKEIVRIQVKWNTKHAIQEWQEYMNKCVQDFAGQPLIFIDECAFQPACCCTQGVCSLR